MAKLNSRKPAAPNVANDTPATQNWVSSHYGSKTANTPQVFEGDVKTPAVITPFDVRYFGANGNRTDNTHQIQAAINAAAKAATGGAQGAVVTFPQGRFRITSSLKVPDNVTLRGLGRGSNLSINPPTIIQGSGGFPLITGSSSTVSGVAIQGLALYGPGATSGSIGISVAGGSAWLIRDCTFDNFGDNAILISAGVSMRIEDCGAQNCLLVRSGRTNYIGVFDVAATDTTISGCEVTSSSTANDTGSGWICALAIRGDNSFIGPGNQFEISETGVYVDSTISNAGTTFVNNRADLNQCHGWVIAGFYCQFIGCWAYRNGQSAGNSFDGFTVLQVNAQRRNVFTGCRAVSVIGFNRHRYGFSDFAQGTLFGGGNIAVNAQTADFHSANPGGVGMAPGSFITGSGSPNTVYSAQVGALYVDTAGGAGTTLYVKETGTGNTGWTAK